MWRVQRVEAVPVELDFSSSGQERIAATAVRAGGVRLFNAIEFVGFESGAMQVYTCECCGCTGCECGGWVTLRRLGECVVWIPAWDEMAEGEWEFREYEPPAFLSSRGAPVFSSISWDHLRSLEKSLPSVEALPPLDSREAVRLCQWSAPQWVLGEFPAPPHLQRKAVLAVTEGELATEVEAINSFLRELSEVRGPMEVVPSQAVVQPIELWLEHPDIPSWKRFAHVEDRLGIVVDDGPTLVPAPG